MVDRALLILAAVNALDVWQTLTNAPQAESFALPFPLSLKAAYAGAWTIVLLVLVTDLVRRRPGAFKWFAPLMTLYGVIGLIGLAVFVRADYGRGRMPFQTLVTLVIVLLAWGLSIRWGWRKRATAPN